MKEPFDFMDPDGRLHRASVSEEDARAIREWFSSPLPPEQRQPLHIRVTDQDVTDEHPHEKSD
jgi:hypothetical protein